MFFATATLATKNDIAQNGNVVIESDECAASGTPRVWKNDRLLSRNTMNDNVQEAANDYAKDADQNVANCGRD